MCNICNKCHRATGIRSPQFAAKLPGDIIPAETRRPPGSIAQRLEQGSHKIKIIAFDGCISLFLVEKRGLG
jgi:hypothetical protein